MEIFIIKCVMLLHICSGNELYILYHRNILVTGYNRSFITYRSTCGAWCQLSPLCSAFAFHKIQSECYLYQDISNCGVNTDGMETFVSLSEDRNNVALFKPTAMSSKFNRNVGSCRAVDGKVTSYASSQKLPMSWWCVDLLHIYNLKNVILYNRNKVGYTRDQIKGFTLKLSIIGSCDAVGFGNAEFCFQDTSPVSESIYNIKTCSTSTPFRARYIFINNGNGSEVLHFKELVVSAI